MESRSRGLILMRGRASSPPPAAPWSWSSPCEHLHQQHCQTSCYQLHSVCQPSELPAFPASWLQLPQGASFSPQLPWPFSHSLPSSASPPLLSSAGSASFAPPPPSPWSSSTH